MTDLVKWARDWNIPTQAVADLCHRMGLDQHANHKETDAQTETGVSQRVRLEYANKGTLLWRNNVGVLKDERGVPVRYGLANESKQMNERIKSSDLIGVEPVLIIPEMVGCTLGRFIAIETKKPGWVFSGTSREIGQRSFHELVMSRGGIGYFTTGS